MKFDRFKQLTFDAAIKELHIESHEGDVFVLRALTQSGEEEVLEDEHGQPLRPQSLGEARKMLIDAGGFEELPLFLVQKVPYDEMIGLDARQEAHKTPLTLHAGI